MFEKPISKDADKLICTLYREYLERRKNGISKEKARDFKDAESIHKSFFPNSLSDDIRDDCFELKSAGLLDGESADNTLIFVSISNGGIIYMENRFKNGLSDVIDFIGKLK